MKKALACAATLLMIGTAVQADDVIPGVRSLTAKEYQLAWAVMGMNAISNCYEGACPVCLAS